MRIFSIQNMLLLSFMMCANGHIMNYLPPQLRDLMGSGTAVAMADKFDMNAMLLQLHNQQQQATGHVQPVQYKPYNFASHRPGTMAVQQLPFPKEELEQALGNNEIPPIVREQVNEIFNQVFSQIGQKQRVSL